MQADHPLPIQRRLPRDLFKGKSVFNIGAARALEAQTKA